MNHELIMASEGKSPDIEYLFAPNRNIQIDNLEDMYVKVRIYLFQDQSFLIVPK